MKSNFCTVVDKNFVFKALALYNSISRQESSFKMWILCMDDETYDVFLKLNLDNLVLIKLSDFETDVLKKIKDGRSRVEYCWTCIPSFVFYLLKKYKTIESLIYLDSDLYVFSDLDEIKNKLREYSILLTPHRDGLSAEVASKGAGIYNAGFYAIKNDEIGLSAIKKWSEQCVNECSDGIDGTYGSQRYLNDWPKKYKRVGIVENKGVNAAVWNISRFEVTKKGKSVFIDGDRLILYHFSRFDILGENVFENNITKFGYNVSKKTVKLIYKPYEAALIESISLVRNIDPKFNFGIKEKDKERLNPIKTVLRAFLELFQS